MESSFNMASRIKRLGLPNEVKISKSTNNIIKNEINKKSRVNINIKEISPTNMNSLNTHSIIHNVCYRPTYKL
tara:strand:+ start:932 stop:1150 length:219 start_codon:yes stop_codon:yes gene_type:complete